MKIACFLLVTKVILISFVSFSCIVTVHCYSVCTLTTGRKSFCDREKRRAREMEEQSVFCRSLNFVLLAWLRSSAEEINNFETCYDARPNVRTISRHNISVRRECNSFLCQNLDSTRKWLNLFAILRSLSIHVMAINLLISRFYRQ